METRTNYKPEYTLSFGKHKHWPISKVPTDYIEWLMGRELPDITKKKLQTELDRR